jgi:hypothetical protein
MKKIFILLLLFIFPLFASVGIGQVRVIEPENFVISYGETFDAGYIGPGQTMSLTIETKVDRGGKYGKGGNWDFLKTENLPEGWTATKSEYGQILKINIRAPRNASEGKYVIPIVVIDDEDLDEIGGEVKFNMEIEVKYDLIYLEVKPEEMIVSTGSPARYDIKLENPSTASDIFIIETEGLKGWEYTKEIFVPSKGKIETYYEIVNMEEKEIPLKVRAYSLSSQKIYDEKDIVLITKSNPYYDILSTKNGLLLYPPFEYLIYGFFYFIASLL